MASVSISINAGHRDYHVTIDMEYPLRGIPVEQIDQALEEAVTRIKRAYTDEKETTQ